MLVVAFRRSFWFVAALLRQKEKWQPHTARSSRKCMDKSFTLQRGSNLLRNWCCRRTILSPLRGKNSCGKSPAIYPGYLFYAHHHHRSHHHEDDLLTLQSLRSHPNNDLDRTRLDESLTRTIIVSRDHSWCKRRNRRRRGSAAGLDSSNWQEQDFRKDLLTTTGSWLLCCAHGRRPIPPMGPNLTNIRLVKQSKPRSFLSGRNRQAWVLPTRTKATNSFISTKARPSPDSDAPVIDA